MLIKYILSLLLTTVTCDLIGYNRLGNNVSNHVQTRNLFAAADYRSQFRRWIFENNVVISDSHMWLKDRPTDQYRQFKTQPTHLLHKEPLLISRLRQARLPV